MKVYFHAHQLESFDVIPEPSPDRVFPEGDEFYMVEVESIEEVHGMRYDPELGYLVPDEDSGIQGREAEAKETRDAAIDAPLLAFTVAWDVDPVSRERMLMAIEESEASAPGENLTTMWRLADNTWRETSTDDLRDVRRAYTARMSAIFTQFATWDAGSKEFPFVPVEQTFYN